jgi:glutaredoxin
MFEVYSKPGCSACEQAKNLIVRKGHPYVEHVLDVGQAKTAGVEYYTKEELLQLFPGARTVPQIYISNDDEFACSTIIGGFDSLVKFFDELENDPPDAGYNDED